MSHDWLVHSLTCGLTAFSKIPLMSLVSSGILSMPPVVWIFWRTAFSSRQDCSHSRRRSLTSWEWGQQTPMSFWMNINRYCKQKIIVKHCNNLWSTKHVLYRDHSLADLSMYWKIFRVTIRHDWFSKLMNVPIICAIKTKCIKASYGLQFLCPLWSSNFPDCLFHIMWLIDKRPNSKSLKILIDNVTVLQN